MPTLSLREVASIKAYQPGDRTVYVVQENRSLSARMVLNTSSSVVSRTDARWAAEHLQADEIEIDMDFYILWYKLSTDTLVVWYEGLPVFADAAGNLCDDRVALLALYQ